MAQKSGKNGIENPKLPSDDALAASVIIDANDLAHHFRAESTVSISLKYFQKSCECFSQWQSRELKKFSATIEKVGGYSLAQLKQNKNLCDIHKGAPDRARFSRPKEISEDIKFYEIKVDPSNKARVHGFFVESVFFLVWLDREHGCFRE